MPDDHSEREPPDPIPNSEVKPLSADGSVGSPHVRVGHRQVLIPKNPHIIVGVFIHRSLICVEASSAENTSDQGGNQ